MTQARTISGPITPSEMAEITPCALWLDGREGYMWCRFDGVLCATRRLRAEITWDDDSDFDDNHDGEPTVFFNAELFIESNLPESPAEERTWITWDGVYVSLSREEAVALVKSDPAEILSKYADQVATLGIWSESDGFSAPTPDKETT